MGGSSSCALSLRYPDNESSVPSIAAYRPQRHPGAGAGWSRGAGNNGPVSTATASSFLNAGERSAWPERVVGVAGPLADLAALVSLGLPGVPGPLQLRG